MALGNPLLLEDLLVRHPKLRVYVMHGGRPRFHEFLRQMFANGFGKRIMFGTDQMRWPEAIGRAIEAVESADFLSHEQRRDILYSNAARFLELTETQVAAHHRQ